MKCPGCGLERRSVAAPCSVCGAVVKEAESAAPAPDVDDEPVSVIAAVTARIKRITDCSELVVATFQIKDREPDEEPVTEKQIGFLKHLAVEVDERELRQLGKWQASDLIEQVLERTKGSAPKAEQVAAVPKRVGTGCGCLLIVIMSWLICWAILKISPYL